jgi:hypothetical protein
MNAQRFVLFVAAAGLLVGSFSTRIASEAPPHQSAPQPAAASTPDGRMYVGSQTCRQCHAEPRLLYERWSRTRMANVVTEPKTRPDAIIPDLSKPDPLVTFTRDEIAFVYGSKWKQRYFKKVGNDYVPLSAQWDIANGVWRPYFVQPNTDW